MLFTSVLLGSLAYLFVSRRYQPGTSAEKRNVSFKDNFWPVESGAWDHAWRHTQHNNTVDYGYPMIGKQEYANPLPYAVDNEFNSSLNETGEGYAIEARNKGVLLNVTGKGAVDVPGQIALIEESFSLEEHPRLDLTRQDISKGRHRRRQWSFVPGLD